ncbi:MAG: DUF4105 domain-containing protein [Candidatus Riflebacteria bacterium]|nr:DUF4105 domain-containing protein [Candidatus Riflebacteria bacterium]
MDHPTLLKCGSAEKNKTPGHPSACLLRPSGAVGVAEGPDERASCRRFRTGEDLLKTVHPASQGIGASLRLAAWALAVTCLWLSGPAVTLGQDPARVAQGQPAFVAGDGASISAQSEWVDEEDPARFQGVAESEVPVRYDLRQPKLVHVEKRGSRIPLYYFRDVRWQQTERPAGRAVGRRAHFTTVVIDLEKVKAAYLCFTPFAPTWAAGHAAIEIEFDRGGFRTLDGRESAGLVWSYEARLRCTQSYAIIPSLYKKVPIIYIVGTFDDFKFRCNVLNTSPLRRWKLEVAPGRLSEMAQEMGKAVLADHGKETYNAVSNSCITATLRVLTRFLPAGENTREDFLFGLIQNPRWVVPVLIDDLLKAKGLIKSPEQVFEPASPGVGQ